MRHHKTQLALYSPLWKTCSGSNIEAPILSQHSLVLHEDAPTAEVVIQTMVGPILPWSQNYVRKNLNEIVIGDMIPRGSQNLAARPTTFHSVG